MIIYGFWLYEELLPFIGFGRGEQKLLSTPHGNYYPIVNSRKLELFKRSPKCTGCGLYGQIWILQSHKKLGDSEQRPHLSLYAINRSDQLIMMTQDHIYPRSAGGADGIQNLQTMCNDCNQRKGNSLPDARYSDRDIGALAERGLRKQRLRALSAYADFLALTQERSANQ